MVQIVQSSFSRADLQDMLRFRMQPLATLSQASPVSGTRYTVLDTVLNARLLMAYAKVTWTGQPDPLTMFLTVDGLEIEIAQANPASTTKYYANFDAAYAFASQGFNTTAGVYNGKSFLLECQSLKIEARTIGGTVSNLSAGAIYAKLV